ncbi:cytochrome c-551 [Lysinibacillus alkalisoli]|uniref:Cytochrome c-551 n=1 Tax=Lysinibacillus alkalisoli TaxID=1911548 RepID=A0A917D7J2_9BACI|nr:cytochrome c [Lysinibacillus alkalisoli]GGG13768.1 cytochrome c-551 [Lysinibacillus alkalisoli]
MKNSPIVPYLLILAMGIAVIFFLSLDGADKKKEAANGGEGGGETTEVNGEEIAKSSCIGCHGGDLSGASGPDIRGLEEDHIADVAMNGQGGMPAILAGKEAEAKAVAEYVAGLEK